MKFCVRIFLPGLLGLLLQAGAGARAADDALSNARQQYREAVRAVDKGHWTEYQQLRPGLDDYPLAIYLDYFQLSRNPGEVRPADALSFIRRSAGSPLPNRFANLYLRQAGKEQRWRDFLAVKPDEPVGIELKCYYFRARLAAGDTAIAWEGARRLWDVGESRPSACDPLFEAWREAGQLSDDMVWSRQLKSFDAGQRSLMEHVGKLASPELAPWTDRLLAVYRQPESIRRQALPAGNPYSADIANHGLALLARYQPLQALQFWNDFQRELSFDAQQVRRVEYAIALNGMFAREQALASWLPAVLERLQDDKLVEIRLRWALAEQDWAAIEQAMPLVSEAAREAEVWRYWRARLLYVRDRTAEADAILADLARERSYHGFLAADRLGRPYSFNHQVQVLDPATAGSLQQMPVVQRVGELNFHESWSLAHSEWYYLLQGSDDRERNRQLAQLAAQQG
ncbi:MAG: hypothetical protein ACRCVD_09210, partial [Halioglobus sp.]